MEAGADLSPHPLQVALGPVHNLQVVPDEPEHIHHISSRIFTYLFYYVPTCDTMHLVLVSFMFLSICEFCLAYSNGQLLTLTQYH
jgi:hypothetical protein